ncbi:MAG: hypothetical protein IAE63_07540 [Alphaproteobacteria bacterium]|jgi:hypothetical protein|nr:hypothetical protein [Alphaproteobacteria bacterium]
MINLNRSVLACFLMCSLAFAGGVSFVFSSVQAAGNKNKGEMSSSSSTSGYLSNLPDIPVMDGMIAQNEDGFVFDAPEGRVVEETVFTSDFEESEVKAYYGTVLPRLGWIARKTGVFVRNGEQLTVNVDKVGDGLRVTFQLAPESD